MSQNPLVYCCTHEACRRAPLAEIPGGLRCPNGHAFPFADGSTVPVFAREVHDANEYARENAAAIHDNALRWVFSTFGVEEPVLRRNLVARIGLKPGMRLLVTGAGAGNDLPYLAEAFGGDGEIHVQDIAQEMLLAGVERHQAACAARGVRLSFSVSDAMNLPFADDIFDAAYHFGGINLFPDIGRGIREMDRLVRAGGRIVIGDEGLAPWLRDTETGRMLVTNNSLYACQAPIALLPETARDVRLDWELCNCFYVMAYTVSRDPLPIDIDVPHVGLRGGSIRKRHAGQLEGVDPALRDGVYAEAKRRGISRVDFIESLLRAGLPPS